MISGRLNFCQRAGSRCTGHHVGNGDTWRNPEVAETEGGYNDLNSLLQKDLPLETEMHLTGESEQKLMRMCLRIFSKQGTSQVN
ncbi:hypothetical protein AMECASPLE_032005 [Ameca splendens]|uniref:Uncharacterized protein n=1 Tax=Ameca splendens TaxID=208324 RepID=A0ABV0ZGB8_9TELE